MKINILEFCIVMDVIKYVFSEPNFPVLEENFKILKFKGLSHLTHFI